MAKYNKAIVKKITDLIRSDKYTIADLCQRVDISKDTYHEWMHKPDFSDAVKRARDEFIESGLVACEKSLMNLIKGYDYEEIKTIYVDDSKGKPKIKEQTKTKKHVAPNLGAIIHFQTNNDPNWKNRQSTELTGKDGKDLIPARVLTKKEAKELLDKLESEY